MATKRLADSAENVDEGDDGPSLKSLVIDLRLRQFPVVWLNH